MVANGGNNGELTDRSIVGQIRVYNCTYFLKVEKFAESAFQFHNICGKSA